MPRAVLVLLLALIATGCVGSPPPPPGVSETSTSTTSGTTTSPPSPSTSESSTSQGSRTTGDGSTGGTNTGTSCRPTCAVDEVCLLGRCVGEPGTTVTSGSSTAANETTSGMDCDLCIEIECAKELQACLLRDMFGASCLCCWGSIRSGTCECEELSLYCEAEIGDLETLLICGANNCATECGFRGCNFEGFECSEPTMVCQ